MKPYYDEGGITIYNGDCCEALAFVDGAFDLVVTSPPYNMGLVPGGNGRGMYRPGASSKAGRFRDGYGLHDDAMPQDAYDSWQRDVLRTLWGRISERGAIFYNHRPRVEHGKVRLPLGFDFGGLSLSQIITWDRGTGVNINLRRYCSAYEWILVFAKADFFLADHSASGTSDMWRLGMDYSKLDHPAPFPVTLPARAIETTTPRNVLDPFMGSGTTLVAAKAAGVRAVGIEIEERFCELAAKRLSQEGLWAA